MGLLHTPSELAVSSMFCMNDKKLLILISKDIIRRNIFDTDFWNTLIEKKGSTSVTLVVESGKEDWFRKQVPESVEVIGYVRTSYRGFSKFVDFLVRTAGNTHSMRTYRNRAYKRGGSTLITYLVRGFIANTIGGIQWYQNLVRKLVLRMHTPTTIEKIYEQFKPTHVFAPSMIDNAFDIPFAIAAKKRSIPVLGMVRSWDNFNNHGLLAVVPDVFLLQNEWLREAGTKFQSIDFGKLPNEITGLPHYDAYLGLKEKNPTSRETFLQSFGIDLNKKIILLGGSDFYYSEYMLPKLLNEAISNGSIKEPTHVIFRPHPSSPFTLEDYGLGDLVHVTLDDAFSGDTKFSDTEKFNNLLCHSDIIMNISSTLSIDAAVVDTPAIAVNFDDPALELSYYEQVGRLYDHFDHYEKLVETGGVRTPDSAKQLVSDINEYLTNPGLDFNGRKRIVDTFVAPFDGRAGKRLAEAVIQNIEVK